VEGRVEREGVLRRGATLRERLGAERTLRPVERCPVERAEDPVEREVRWGAGSVAARISEVVARKVNARRIVARIFFM